MQTVSTIGLDIAKSVFQVHGIDEAGQVIIRRQLKRRHVLVFFQKLPSMSKQSRAEDWRPSPLSDEERLKRALGDRAHPH
jgi:transposase